MKVAVNIKMEMKWKLKMKQEMKAQQPCWFNNSFFKDRVCPGEV